MTGPDLAAAAEAVLRGNDRGEYTAPSLRQYPHQWNWDSAFAAIGWAHLDWDRAAREVDSLLRGQWTDGCLPHIRYAPHAPAGYQPDPSWWPGVPVRHPSERTSGISQPPVLPTAVRMVGEMRPDIAPRWWARLWEPLRDLVRYYLDRRTTGGCPLIVVIHPWESGTDNSPRWDGAVGRGLRPARAYRREDTAAVEARQRPTDRDYDLYYALVEMIADAGYDLRRLLPRTPFAVYDALFNAVWYRAARDLNHIAAVLGRPPAVSPDVLAAFADAYRRTLWRPESGIFADFDVVSGALIPADTVAGLGAIYGGLVDAAGAAALLDRYLARCAGCLPVPSVPPDQPGFEPDRYWRGPVWVNVNWMVARGLDDLGLRDRAAALAAATVDLVRRGGWREYFHPYTGAGLGADGFTWTAALVLDLVKRPVG
ncbi:MAG: hypothetical protein QN173_03515 [Armatimonadota bacterium]|nr:hypothetical protein [Armatimonadota bacterium]